MAAEFLLTNQFGGYSSFDLVTGVRRKYHGLLVAGLNGFARFNIVTAMQEKLGEVDFSAFVTTTEGQAPQTKFLTKSFYLPQPTQTFQIEGTSLKKTISFDEVSNTTTLRYELDTAAATTLSLRPLLNFRDIHVVGLNEFLRHKKQAGLFQHQGKFIVYLSAQWQLVVTSDMNFQPLPSNGELITQPIHYPAEAERGYEADEELFPAGEFRLECPQAGNYAANISFQVEPRSSVRRLWQLTKFQWESEDNPSLLADTELMHSRYPELDKSFAEFLAYNARKFLVKDKTRQSLIAGYHWFGEWGRDTFISFRGLLLGLGKYAEAQSVLMDWSRYLSVGLLPNMMEGLHYNSLDAVLWYFQALHHYYQDTRDRETVLALLPKLEQVIDNLVVGSKYGIQVNPQGYLIWTDTSKALTWMDAIVDGQPVTGRTGAAVEIQALWLNALQIVEQLASACNYQLKNLALIDQLEHLLEESLWKDFWSEERQQFADFIDLEAQPHWEFRPNQLAMLALPYRPMNLNDQTAQVAARKLLERVEAELLTPVGLRTLSPQDPNYKPVYTGSQEQRDLAYHQGTVWPWLLTLYAKAKLNYALDKAIAKTELQGLLANFWKELQAQELISIPELFNADDLKAGGTTAQAWSTAAPIEIIMDVYGYSRPTA